LRSWMSARRGYNKSVARATKALLRALYEGDCTHTIRINRRAAVRGGANTYARGQ
jgi:hypothetical protein